MIKEKQLLIHSHIKSLKHSSIKKMKKDIKSREDITLLVNTFYTQVRENELLGPIFNTMIKDWETHLVLLTDFWETNLFFVKKYTGNPLEKHAEVDKYYNWSISYLSGNKFPTWYVPSINELALVYKEKKAISSLLDLNDEGHILWSSSEGGEVWKGHNDGPNGGNFGETIEGYSGVKVSLGGKKDAVTGVACLNFYTGKSVTIAKTYDNPFILIRKF